jgi:hypothetical protein
MIDRKIASDQGAGTMLRRAKDMLGYSIIATDGEVGSISDLVIDDEHFKLRYVVIDTGDGLSRRRVLLAPSSISNVQPERKTVMVSLDRRDVEGSPSYEPEPAECERMVGKFF